MDRTRTATCWRMAARDGVRAAARRGRRGASGTRSETGLGRSERVARTPRDYPIVSVTFWQLQNGAVRLAGTGMQERPCRLTTAEAKLVDGLTPEAIAQAGQAAQSAATHPGDFRGDAAYRAEMTAVLIQRVCK